MRGRGVKVTFPLERLEKKRISFVGLLCRTSGSFVLGMVLEYCLAPICTGLCRSFGYQSSDLAVIVAKALRKDIPRWIFCGTVSSELNIVQNKIQNKSIEPLLV